MVERKKTKSESLSDKSDQIRKYEPVYEKCLQRLRELNVEKKQRRRPSPKHTESPENTSEKPHRKRVQKQCSESSKLTPTSKRRLRKEEPHPSPERKTKKKLTDYQKYVKKESKKVKYKDVSPRSRLKSIGRDWKKSKDSTAKTVSSK
jgi:hypothetical protein